MKISFPHSRMFVWICFLLTACSTKEHKDGVNTVYYPGTEIVQQTVEYLNGKKNGKMTNYYRNGRLKAIQHYRNDTVVDTTFYFHNNGKISSYQIVKDGKKTGCWRSFNPQGKLFKEMCFDKDYFEGPSREFTYKTLHLIKKLNFKKGRKHGKQELFYNNGHPQSITWYEEGFPCKGTEEWLQSGKKIKNEFKISISEIDEVLLSGKLRFVIGLENPKPDDKVYLVYVNPSNNCLTPGTPLEKEKDSFLLEYDVGKGGFIMKEVTIAAYRTTSLGNVFIQTKTFNVSANNF